jgi:uncharacterized YigZ family protein
LEDDVERQLIPAREARSRIRVVNSRFIATIAPAFTVEEARAFIDRMEHEFEDATHNVPAYVIGHGASLITHCSDDGEPAGTAGPPTLAVLQGSGLGDVVVVVTRYFGGTKLGTGGLVRAYSDAVREVLSVLPRAVKVPTHTVRIEMPYSLFEQIRRLVKLHRGQVLDEMFAAEVTVTAQLPRDALPKLQNALQQISRGKIEPCIIGSSNATIVPVETR